MSENFNLKWKNYPEHILGVFRDLANEALFEDVTLISDDKIQTQAHKVVLGACSPVLKSILASNVHSHPLLYLKGVQQSELQAILKFMYFGEVQILENRINEFMNVAKDFQLKQISWEEMSNWEEDEDERNKEEETNEDCIEYVVEEPTKEENNRTPVKVVEKFSRVKLGRPRKVDKNFSYKKRQKCNLCDDGFLRTEESLKYHIKSIHEGVRYDCDQCDNQLTSAQGLRYHINAIHGEIKYPCNKSDIKASTKTNLKEHLNMLHKNRKYSCEFLKCKFLAKTKKYLSVHVNAMHKNKKFECNDCDYTSNFKTGLNHHRKTKH